MVVSAFRTGQHASAAHRGGLGDRVSRSAASAFLSHAPALPTARLNGRAAKGGIALINVVGNIGGFPGPFVIGCIKNTTARFTDGLLFVAGGVLVTGPSPS